MVVLAVENILIIIISFLMIGFLEPDFYIMFILLIRHQRL